MAEYIEIKKIFCEMLGVADNNSVDEENDIVIPVPSKNIRNTEMVIDNAVFKKAYDSMQSKSVEGMQLYSERNYEVAITVRWLRGRSICIEDSVNEIEYTLGPASYEYIVMVCKMMCDNRKVKEEVLNAIHFYSRLPFRDELSVEEYISRTIRIKTIRIDAKKEIKLASFVQFCNSFEYLYMYKTRHSIMKIIGLEDLFERSGGGRARVSQIDEPPRRTINQDTLEYYAKAVDSEDPFVAYISFYHILEYYFDAVYKKKLVNEMKNKLTDPSFSYKNEKKLYDLAKWVGNKMKNDDQDGRGNELESLKYVLEEYVPIQEIERALNEWNPSLSEYYTSQNVVFSGCRKDKIAWTDLEGVYTNLANRIYNTRNALVHSKSGQVERQYKPHMHKDALIRELPLVQVIAELILFKDGDAL